ncbi:MAG TPA: hypothetical protein VLM75_05815 [Spirochaetota bacterium]|nr:hypothetical protein [Spirochaetota bacterium]
MPAGKDNFRPESLGGGDILPVAKKEKLELGVFMQAIEKHGSGSVEIPPILKARSGSGGPPERELYERFKSDGIHLILTRLPDPTARPGYFGEMDLKKIVQFDHFLLVWARMHSMPLIIQHREVSHATHPVTVGFPVRGGPHPCGLCASRRRGLARPR